MVSEGLARRFKPAGFDQPEGSRRKYEVNDRLVKAFYQWVRELPDDIHVEGEFDRQYKKACEAVKEFGEPKIHEAHGLLFGFRPKREVERSAGLFVSACYNQSLEKEIIVDVDSEDFDYLGYKTPADKVLINKASHSGESFGFEALCPVVNLGMANTNFGNSSIGAVINNREAQDYFGYGSQGSVINNRHVGKFMGSGAKGPVINNGRPDPASCGEHMFGEDSENLLINNGDGGVDFGHKAKGKIILVEEANLCFYQQEGGDVIGTKDCVKVPELKQYLEELKQISGAIKDFETARRFVERYGVSGEKIEPEIKGILRIL